jgi:hypothetical protein
MSTVGELLRPDNRPPFVRFERRPIEDKEASLKAGHYVARDIDFALITPPSSKDVFIQKVPAWFDQLQNDLVNERIPEAWVKQYKEAYEAWKRGEEPPLHGSPIKGWGMISPAIQETLVRMHILTIEDLAAINAEGITRIGMGALDLKTKARVWLDQNKNLGPLTMEMASDKAKIRTLEDQVATLSGQVEKLMNQAQQQEPPMERTDVPHGTITAADIMEEEPMPPALVTLTDHASLVARYTEKFGKAPHHRMLDSTIAEALK